jgi:hypothetical protein
MIARLSLNARPTIVLSWSILSRRQTGHSQRKEEQNAGEEIFGFFHRAPPLFSPEVRAKDMPHGATFKNINELVARTSRRPIKTAKIGAGPMTDLTACTLAKIIRERCARDDICLPGDNDRSALSLFGLEKRIFLQIVVPTSQR